MNVVTVRQQCRRAWIAPAALGALVLTAGCGGGEDPETGQPDPDTAGAEVFTFQDVEENNTPESCWAVLDETVYDLTGWIAEHPGGPERIEQLCGTDATEAFADQHSGQSRPEDQLAELEIGTLED